MGIDSKTYNIGQLGEYLTADWSKNGSWIHNAFVTQVDNYYAIYSNDAGSIYHYKDFKVVQRTNDYYAWVSSNVNGWDKFRSG